MNAFKTVLLAATVAACASLGAASASADTLRAHTTAAGAAPNTTMKLLSRYAVEAGLDVQVIEGQVMPRSMVALAQGQIEMMTAIMGQFAAMQGGRGPFADMAEQGAEAAAQMRSLFEFGAASQHFVVWADSGIETWSDLEGRTVFTGPGGGGASSDTEEMIRLLTGFEPDQDYTAIRAPWSEGMAAMRNGQVDALYRVAPVGSAVIQEFGLSRGIRLLSFSEADLEAIADYLAVPGRVSTTIPAGSYEGMVNEGDVQTVSFGAALAVNQDMDDDTAYALTSAFWDNIGEIKDSAAFLRTLDASAPFNSLIIPLHPGAVRYYDETGVAIPDALRP